ncbi:MAG: hypothetical protein M1834_009486 [Cirrosporium novae-zelandiae]|nr:MAG: hypothetical protein M1834_009486 [Cirrosporium novae-zelandiae]
MDAMCLEVSCVGWMAPCLNRFLARNQEEKAFPQAHYSTLENGINFQNPDTQTLLRWMESMSWALGPYLRYVTIEWYFCLCEGKVLVMYDLESKLFGDDMGALRESLAIIVLNRFTRIHYQNGEHLQELPLLYEERYDQPEIDRHWRRHAEPSENNSPLRAGSSRWQTRLWAPAPRQGLVMPLKCAGPLPHVVSPSVDLDFYWMREFFRPVEEPRPQPRFREIRLIHILNH